MQDTGEAIRILEDVIKCNSYEGVKQVAAQFENRDRRVSNEYGKLHSVSSLDQVEKNVEALTEKVKKLVDHGKRKLGRPSVLSTSISNEKGKREVVGSSSARGYWLMPTKLAGEITTWDTLRKIWDCLMSDDVRKIGVYGMGGIGKTTIMKHINNCLLEDINGKFDKVIWVTISKTPDIVKLQNDIAQQLDFDLSKYKDMTIRVSMLYNALRERRRYVLILDDMWNKFLLPDIGIPEPTIENDCKLVLTTRTLDVCDFMKTDENVQIGFLSEEEAFNLFLDHVGRDILLVHGLKPIVEDVSRRCACLPLAIVIVASSMAGKKKIYEWKTARRKLRSKSKDPDDKAKEVLEQLRFSFESLKSRMLQDCLLYCALYHEDDEIPVLDMIELLINVGIIEDMPSRQDQFDEGHYMFATLKNVCFLEDVRHHPSRNDPKEYVKMHDLVRDMTLQVAGDRFMVEAGLRLKELPKEKNWSKNLMEVSLMKNKITEFPSNISPVCPKLSVLLLQDNPFEVIPNSFFEHMLGLKVLNLSNTSIEILPNSVSNLVNLEALLLRRCYKLRYMPSLAMMKNLRSLSLAYSHLDELPQGLEELTDLKYLDLTWMKVEIPHGLLPRVSQLQYLAIVGIILNEELMSLEKLESFGGGLPNIKSFNEYFNHRDLEGGLIDYDISVGGLHHLALLQSSHLDKSVCLMKCNISKRGDMDDVLMLPKDIQVLTVEDDSSISSLCDIASLDNVTDLRECSIDECDKVEVLISSPSSIMLPLKSLEVLYIRFLSSLRDLIGREAIELRALPTSTFSCLRKIVILGCSEIEEVFPIALIPYLQSLEDIEVSTCGNLVRIVGGTSITSNITFPRLRVLALNILPELQSICSSPSIIVCNSLERIFVNHTFNLKMLPISLPLDDQGQPCPLPSLQTITMAAEAWETMEWAHPSTRTVLQRFHRNI